MTVAELIEELRKHPGNTRLYVAGYEGGVDDVYEIMPIQVHRDVNPESYYGNHEAHYDNTYCRLGRGSDDKCPSTEPGLELR